MTNIIRRRQNGFETVTAENECVSVTVVPELGARILSLRQARFGREWMWRPPGPMRLWRNKITDPFEAGTFTGADECFPTIGACTWEGRPLPDHGEAWSTPWSLDEVALREGLVRTTVALPLSPFRLTREIMLAGKTVALRYCLTNTGRQDEAWLWAWHPLIALEPEDRLELPSEITGLRVESAMSLPFSRGAWCAVGAAGAGMNLTELCLGDDPAFLKAFAGPLRESWARLHNADSGDSLLLRWGREKLPHLGLWLTRGGYKGWHHVALEPTNLPGDCLADAIRETSPQRLAAGESASWWMEIAVERS